MLKAAKLVRKKVVEMLEGVDEVQGDSISSFVLSKHALLCSLDRNWKVEEAFFVAMSGKAGAECLQQAVLDTLPSAETAKTANEVLNALAQVAKGGLVALLREGAAKLVQHCEGVGDGHLFAEEP